MAIQGWHSYALQSRAALATSDLLTHPKSSQLFDQDSPTHAIVALAGSSINAFQAAFLLLSVACEDALALVMATSLVLWL